MQIVSEELLETRNFFDRKNFFPAESKAENNDNERGAEKKTNISSFQVSPLPRRLWQDSLTHTHTHTHANWN